MKLHFHHYRYYPYERELAAREIAALLGAPVQTECSDGIKVDRVIETNAAERLVYFSAIQTACKAGETIQSRLERAGNAPRNRQSTRYSVHGLHDYKGKFNPQVAKALLNIFGIKPNDLVLDPFCGSGTALVECSHIGARSIGVDLNPFAIFLANAKSLALSTPAAELIGDKAKLKKALTRTRNPKLAPNQGLARLNYLRSWFDEDILAAIEFVRDCVEQDAPDTAPVFLSIASNLLRSYSLQDPSDLRIRRRKSPLPTIPFVVAFLDACDAFIARIGAVQDVLDHPLPKGEARIGSATSSADFAPLPMFDAVLTSPPYAMALPYVDTQRLSLVWLDLIQADEIIKLEARLTGSREMRGGDRKELLEMLRDNGAQLPFSEFALCVDLQARLTNSDGFRRKAVPRLLYRYFSHMHDAFRNIRQHMKPNAPFGLIVGHNHTVLGGVRCDIDTPHHLASLAQDVGWKLDELIELQTYRRYGLHASNAVQAESLILLRNPM